MVHLMPGARRPANPTHVRAAARLRRAAPWAGLLLAALLNPVAPAAQEPEVPMTLFSAALGDATVDLAAAGSWSGSLSAGIGVLFTPGLPARPLDQFPELAQGIAFNQVPDLTLAVTLMERYFVELSVLGGVQDNWLLMGYRGKPGELVQSVVGGNREIGIDPSPFLEVPSQSQGSLGASAEIAGPGFSSELMLRWDATGRKRKLFLGLAELMEERIGPEAFSPGTYFFLPDPGVNDLVIYLEEAGGPLTGSDGRSYRPAVFADVVLDSAAGLVSLKKARTGRVLAYHTKNGLPVGTQDPQLGQNALPADVGGLRDITSSTNFYWTMPTYLGASMSDRRVTVDGHECLLLWQPGDQSPFQLDSSYPVEAELPQDPSRTQVSLESRVAGTVLPTGLSFRVLPAEQRVVVYAGNDFRSTFLNVYPFHDADPAASINLLYGPDRADLAGKLPFDILVQALRPVERHVLEPGVVPGSVRVTINGIEEQRFEVDAGSGGLTFQRQILPTDRIEVSYRTIGTGTSDGDAVLAWRGEVDLSDSVDLWAAAGLRWNLGSATFSDLPYEHTGTAIAALGIEGTSGELSWGARVAGSFTDPDTTGIARLHGMEGRGIEVGLLEESAWPSAPPVDPGGLLSSLNRDNRGKLLYKDYREYDALGGSTLHAIDWPDALGVPYENGGRPGPYNVLGSSAGDATGASLVLDFSMEAVQWVGAQMPIVSGQMPDLSTAKSVTIRFRPYALSGSVDLYLELGGLSEDIDGDGVLDAEVSTADTGFPFNDTSNAVVLKVGAGPRLQGNGVRDTEDSNGNDILDLEDRPWTVQRLVSSFPGAVTEPPVVWPTVTLDLSDQDRGRLVAARGIRLVVVNTSGATNTGIIQVDSITVDGSGYWIEVPGDPNPSIREIPEPLALHDPGRDARLEDDDRFSKQIEKFHPSGARQEVLEADWSGATGDVLITGYSDSATPSASVVGAGIQYDTAVAYVRAFGLSGASAIDFELSDSSGKGIGWILDPASLADGAWHEVRASRSEGTIQVDGTTVSGAPSFDEGYGPLSHLLVTVSVPAPGPGSGTLYLDEIHLRDPRAAWGAAFEAEASWQVPGTILAVRGVPILANASVRQELAAATAGFSSLYDVPRAGPSILSKTEVGVDLFPARVAFEALLGVDNGQPIAAGSHRIAIPVQPSVFSLADAYSLSRAGEFSREDALTLAPLSGVAMSLETEAHATSEVLTQSWSGTLDLGPVRGVSLGVDIDLGLSAAGYTLEAGWYGARWLHDAALILPWEGDGDLERREEGSGTISAAIGPAVASATIAAAAWSTQVTEISRVQQNTLESDFVLQLPIGGGAGGAVTFEYARPLVLTGQRDRGDRFIAEASDFAEVMLGQRYFLASVPFLELFQDNGDAILAAWSGVDQGSWNPSAGLSWERRPGSRPLDLLLPSLIELSAERDLEHSDRLSQDEVSLGQRVGWHALNLFGRLGSTPIARFYRTDEFSLGVASTQSLTRTAPMAVDELSVDACATFFGERDGSFTILGSFELPRPLTVLQATLDWSVRPPAGIRLPYLPVEIAQTGFFAHEEGLKVSMGEERDGHPFTVVVRHATSIKYPDHGWLKAEVKAGVDTERLAGGVLASRLAISASLEARVEF